MLPVIWVCIEVLIVQLVKVSCHYGNAITLSFLIHQNTVIANILLVSVILFLVLATGSSSHHRRHLSSNTADEAQPVEPIRRLPSNRKTSERGIEAEDSVNQGIDAIIDFNNVEDRPAIDKWYIGIGCLRKLTERGDNVIKRVLKSRQEEIDAHNSKHELGKWHNARGKDYPSIETIIPFN